MLHECLKHEPSMCNDSTGVFGECSSAKRSKTSDPQQSLSYNPIVNWSHLPDIIIREIYDKLNFTDRTSASSVCKHWRRNVYHWKWWKDVTFTIEPYATEKSKYQIPTFAKIVSNATIKVNTLSTECIKEFVSLVQMLADNPNLRSLIIEPTHCRFEIPTQKITDSEENDFIIIVKSITECLPKLNRFSIGCIEDLSNEVENFLEILRGKNSKNVTVLGLASVKDEPGICKSVALRPSFIKPFSGLEILSIDYDDLCDELLCHLNTAVNLKRLIVHLHSIRKDHPGTSTNAWCNFSQVHPSCELRLTVIHAFNDIKDLHRTVLRQDMPLSHLKVFFCESVNLAVLEFVSENFRDTLRSFIWVDSLSHGDNSWAIATPFYEAPDPFLVICWVCKLLEEVIFYGYKYWEENLIAIARLRGSKLQRLEIAEDDILFHNTPDVSPYETCLKDVPMSLKRPWAPIHRSELHPVICNPTAGDSDEYLLPLVLADLQ